MKPAIENLIVLYQEELEEYLNIDKRIFEYKYEPGRDRTDILVSIISDLENLLLIKEF